jgi:molecular chaperone GrpE
MSDINENTPPPETEGAEAGVPPEFDLIVKLQAENAELKDRVVRTLAEMENLRKRTEKEVADSRAYAVTAFARDIVGVTDNLDRALSAVPAEEAENPALKALAEGVDITNRGLASVLAKHNVVRIDPQPGEKFDPNIHQAIFEVPDTALPSGSVVQVVQAGFTISGRLLRPAMVGVSKGAPKTAPADVLPSDVEPSEDQA